MSTRSGKNFRDDLRIALRPWLRGASTRSAAEAAGQARRRSAVGGAMQLGYPSTAGRPSVCWRRTYSRPAFGQTVARAGGVVGLVALVT